jgi:hypothetical protein
MRKSKAQLLGVPEPVEDLYLTTTAYPDGEVERLLYFKPPIFQVVFEDPTSVYIDNTPYDED